MPPASSLGKSTSPKAPLLVSFFNLQPFKTLNVLVCVRSVGGAPRRSQSLRPVQQPTRAMPTASRNIPSPSPLARGKNSNGPAAAARSEQALAQAGGPELTPRHKVLKESSAQSYELFEEIDSNGDGVIDADEFNNAMRQGAISPGKSSHAAPGDVEDANRGRSVARGPNQTVIPKQASNSPGRGRSASGSPRSGGRGRGSSPSKLMSSKNRSRSRRRGKGSSPIRETRGSPTCMRPAPADDGADAETTWVTPEASPTQSPACSQPASRYGTPAHRYATGGEDLPDAHTISRPRSLSPAGTSKLGKIKQQVHESTAAQVAAKAAPETGQSIQKPQDLSPRPLRASPPRMNKKERMALERQMLADQSPKKERTESQSPKAPLTEEEQGHEKKKHDEARKKARRRCVCVCLVASS